MIGSALRVVGAALAVAFGVAPLAAANPQYAGYDDSGWYVDEFPAGIALFSGPNFTGEVREAFDIFGSMHDLAFNDRARSVAVLAGQWELCEHRDFTGRCIFIREDVADLRWFGLAGRVSSIRPVFEYTEAEHGLLFIRDHHGYIRYVHDEYWADQYWHYGYARSRTLTVRHYGFGPDYWRHGYYDPRWGYDPYGFAWNPYGYARYTSHTIRVHPRPVVINHYWRERPRDHWRGHRGARPSHPPRGRDHRRADDRDYRGPRSRDDRYTDRPRDQRPRDDRRQEARGDDRQWSGRGGPGRDWQGRDGQRRDGQGRDGRPRGDDTSARGPRRGEGSGAERPGTDRPGDGRLREAGDAPRQWQGRGGNPGGEQVRGPRPGAGEIPRDPRGSRREASAPGAQGELRGPPRSGGSRSESGERRGRAEGAGLGSSRGNMQGESPRRGGNQEGRSGGGSERAERAAPPPQPQPRREISASPPRPQPERQREAARPPQESRRPEVRREAPPERQPRVERGDNRSRPVDSFDPSGDNRRR